MLYTNNARKVCKTVVMTSVYGSFNEQESKTLLFIRLRQEFMRYVRNKSKDAYYALLAYYYGHALSNYEKDLLLGLSREFKKSIK